MLDGAPIVLFRTKAGLHALADRCPHRHAPLSGGRVVGEDIECPYHGWRFDGTGLCRTMPGLGEGVPRIAVPARDVIERDGIIFVSRGHPLGPVYTRALTGPHILSLRVESRVCADLVDVAENILDATHTHFTHKGLLRGLSRARQRNKVTIKRSRDMVEAIYEGEVRQDGLVSRLLERGRTISIGRFLPPAIVELEFRGPRGPNLVTTFHLREETPGVTRGIGILAGPRQYGLGYLKAAAFVPLFRIGAWQDRSILSSAARNRRLFGDPNPVMAPLDFLRADIKRLMAGEALEPSVTEREIWL
jgi:phenylpropionate dioxygenase-like ring-hydroxylating dioxygenase large terminal subunit